MDGRNVKGYVLMDGIFPVLHKSVMTDELHSRITARLKQLQMTATEVSRKAGLNAGYLRDLQRKNAEPTVRNLAKIASALGVSPEWLSTGDQKSLVERQPVVAATDTRVEGIIEAGAFRDISIPSQDDRPPTIPAPQNTEYPQLRQYALEVHGDSMNKMILPGSYVVCVPFWETGHSLRDGMIVHVERSIAGTHLVETTLKQVAMMDGEVWLVPQSTNELHKPIPMDGDEATVIEIKGLAVSLWKPLPRTW